VAFEDRVQLTRCVATGPEIGLDRLPRLVADLGSFVSDPARGVERGIDVVLHREVGVERRQGKHPSRHERPGDAGHDGVVVVLVDHQAEGALTQADRGVELLLERQLASVESLERRAVRRVASAPARRTAR
jgi:hypothetical protein